MACFIDGSGNPLLGANVHQIIGDIAEPEAIMYRASCVCELFA